MKLNSLFRILVLGAALIVSACSAPAAPPTSAKAQSVSNWPILYTDIVQTDGKNRAVTKAVDLQGKDLGIAAETFGTAWAPDGKSFAFIPADGTALLQQTLGGQATTLLRANPDEKFRRLPIWSPDGKRLAIISRTPDRDDGKQVIVVENAKVVARYTLPPLAEEHIWNPNKFRWSPDSKKILLSWDYTIVVHTDTNQVETISDQHVMAEWAPNGNAVYYFELVTSRWPSYGDLGNFNLKKLGDAMPTVLMNQEQVSALGLHTNISAFELRANDLQFNRGLMNLSPSGTKLVLVTGLGSGSRFSFYAIAPDGTVVLDRPEKTIEVDSSTGSVEWAPDETQLAVIAVGGKDGPAVKALDLKTAKWKILAPLGFQMPSYHLMEQVNLILTISAKTLSWTQ